MKVLVQPLSRRLWEKRQTKGAKPLLQMSRAPSRRRTFSGKVKTANLAARAARQKMVAAKFHETLHADTCRYLLPFLSLDDASAMNCLDTELHVNFRLAGGSRAEVKRSRKARGLYPELMLLGGIGDELDQRSAEVLLVDGAKKVRRLQPLPTPRSDLSLSLLPACRFTLHSTYLFKYFYLVYLFLCFHC
jgi:hypothetical protein